MTHYTVNDILHSIGTSLCTPCSPSQPADIGAAELCHQPKVCPDD